MSATLTSHIPNIKPSSFLCFSLKSSKIVFPKIPELVFLGGFQSRMPNLGKKIGSFGSKPMTELSKIGALRSSDGDGETQTILRSGSSEIGREMGIAGLDLEALLNESSKWLVSVLFGAIILWKHDAEAMWAAIGAVLNSSLSVTLKRVLNQQRPVPTLRSDPGMPSSHAQSIFFIVSFALLLLTEWLGINAFTITAGAFLLTCGSYFSWLRVSQKLHSVSQVAVGAILGSIFAMVWFWSWDAFILEAFQSSIWVRIIVILFSASFCLAFAVYVVKNWLLEDD